MKKRILILLGILIIGGGAAAGVCWKMGVFGQQETSGDSVYVTKISDLTGQTSGVSNRYAGVVEPQETVSVELESGRTVKEVQVKTGDQVKKGQLLFEYDLSSIQESLEEAQLDLDRLKNEASSLNERIATLEKEKKKASQDNQLSYTIEIETNKMNLKKNEYSQKSKQAEIDKLQSATGNTEVRSSIDGVIQKIDTSKLTTEDNSSVDDTDSGDSSSDDSSSGGSNAFITILSTGAYRIKGTVNELNVNSIVEGEPVIIRSRVDDSQTWKGTMGTIDKDSASSGNNNNSFYGMTDSSDSQTSTSTYPFYVNLDSSDGLMLGQHVYIEMDEGQEEKQEVYAITDYKYGNITVNGRHNEQVVLFFRNNGDVGMEDVKFKGDGEKPEKTTFGLDNLDVVNDDSLRLLVEGFATNVPYKELVAEKEAAKAEKSEVDMSEANPFTSPKKQPEVERA